MYLLDANVFIEAKNRYYSFDLAPGFWEWLDAAADVGAIGSVRAVADELIRGTDELAIWARSHSRAFHEPDDAVAAQMANVAVWANSQDFTAAAVSEFLSVADFQLVAHAAAYGHTVVTHEQPQAGAKKRVLIPNACEALGVAYCNTFAMLRSHSVQLDLRVD
jgi:predicted nucleic acid-binding protein